MILEPPESVQKLQAALQAKAKGSPGYRFYLLYDKLYRKDVLEYAYRCCKANRGAPGVEIRVSDRGPGIPNDEVGQVFDPFYRGKRAIADQIHGTGLGLSLTKRIIEAHRGTISVSSKPGQGTEFQVRIPVEAPAV